MTAQESVDSKYKDLDWRIASASGSSNCVQVALLGTAVAVRDSKNPTVVHHYSSSDWRSLVRKIKTAQELQAPS
ncbi:MAG: hypothetical protein JWL58_7355 [Streptosporangiaceae bacterium]|jgi:hypothetical protein|nr:hypothetical protein [Streptosporangiaceae bacterium]